MTSSFIEERKVIKKNNAIAEEYLRVLDICGRYWIGRNYTGNNSEAFGLYYTYVMDGFKSNLHQYLSSQDTQGVQGIIPYDSLEFRTKLLAEKHADLIPEFKEQIRNQKLEQLLND